MTESHQVEQLTDVQVISAAPATVASRVAQLRWEVRVVSERKAFNYNRVRQQYKSQVSRAVWGLRLTITTEEYGEVELRNEDLARYSRNLAAAIEAAKRGDMVYKDDKKKVRPIPDRIRLEYQAAAGAEYHTATSDFVKKRAAMRRLASHTFPNGQIGEVIAVDERFEVLIREDETVLERHPFRTGSDAELFLRRLHDDMDGTELLRSSASYRDDVAEFYRTKRLFEQGKINKDAVHIVPRFGFLVAIHEHKVATSRLQSQEVSIRNTLTRIIKNEPLPQSDSTSWQEKAEEWIGALCKAPNQAAFSDITQTLARLRVRVLKKVLRTFAADDPTKKFSHLTKMEKWIADNQKTIIKQYKKYPRKGVFNPEGTLNNDGHHASLELSEVEYLLDFLAKEDLAKYHYALVSLSIGVRPTEAARVALHTHGYIDRDLEKSWELDMASLVNKTDGQKLQAAISIVGHLILTRKDDFPIVPFESRDWNTGYTKNFRAVLGFDFYTRRLRTTCAVMLTICEREINDLQIRSTRQFLKARGGWAKESSIDMDVYTSGNVRGATMFPGRFFGLDEVEERAYHHGSDLLEGQTSWDAFLLRHFIRTHLKRFNEFIKDQAMRERRIETFFETVLQAQESYMTFSGWVRRHNAGTGRVIFLITKGLLWEAVGELMELVQLKSDKKQAILVRAHVQEERQKYVLGLEQQMEEEFKVIEAEFVEDDEQDDDGEKVS